MFKQNLRKSNPTILGKKSSSPNHCDLFQELKKLVQFSKSTEVIKHRTLDYFNGWRPKQKTKKLIFDKIQHSFTINVASKLGR